MADDVAGNPPNGQASLAARCADAPPLDLLTGIELFNRREFFACHEALEAVWLRERHPVRNLYQGILQIGVAFYHLGRGNERGAHSLLAAGIERLSGFPVTCQTVDVEALLTAARHAQSVLARLPPGQSDAFDQSLIPTIRLTSPR